jgi:hypothetical protein
VPGGGFRRWSRILRSTGSRCRSLKTWPSAAISAIPIHRATPSKTGCVDPQKRRLGVAVVAAGDGEVFYVEEFTD